jgi:hypothetical protein
MVLGSSLTSTIRSLNELEPLTQDSTIGFDAAELTGMPPPTGYTMFLQYLASIEPVS